MTNQIKRNINNMNRAHNTSIPNFNFCFNNEQTIAVNSLMDGIINDKHVQGLFGYAGTGKTTLITLFVKELIKCKKVKDIIFIALSHKALSVLKKKILEFINEDEGDDHIVICPIREQSSHVCPTISFITLASINEIKLFYNDGGDKVWAKSKSNTKYANECLFIIDECSMVSEESYEKIKSYDRQSIFLGDIAQLPPIKCKFNIFKNIPCSSKLTTIIRTRHSDISELCTLSRNEIPDEFNDTTNISIIEDYDEWIQCISNDKNVSSIALSWTNRSVDSINNDVRNILFDNDELNANEKVCAVTNTNKLNSSDPFIIDNIEIKDYVISRDDKGLKIKPHHVTLINNDEYKMINTNIKDHSILDKKCRKLIYEDESVKTKSRAYAMHYKAIDKYIELKHGYATTVHKAQGSQYDHVYVNLRDIDDSRDSISLFYTAISRAVEKLIILI